MKFPECQEPKSEMSSKTILVMSGIGEKDDGITLNHLVRIRMSEMMERL
jgi:hypothetical protein